MNLFEKLWNIQMMRINLFLDYWYVWASIVAVLLIGAWIKFKIK